jgi:pimeloyl-ACP methyl ester carboxylesterase
MSKKTVILINGGPSLSNYISSLEKLISHEYHVVEYFQKGTPENPTSNKDDLTLKSHLQELKNIVSKYTGPELILIGHSWGADLALLFLADNPGLVGKTILIGTAPLDDEISRKFAQNIQLRLTEATKGKLQNIKSELEHATSDVEKNLLMQKRLSIIGPTYHFNPSTEARLNDLKWDYSSFVISIDSLWDFIDSGKVPQTLARITDPVVAFHGDHDPIPENETFDFLRKHIKGIKTVEVKKAGHFPWLEKGANEIFLRTLLAEMAQ